MPRQEVERATIDQLTAFMEQVKSGRVSRSVLDVFMKTSGHMSADELAMSAERVKAERLYRKMLGVRHAISAPACPVDAELLEDLSAHGFQLFYLPSPVGKKWPWKVEPTFVNVFGSPSAVEHMPIRPEGHWLAVETIDMAIVLGAREDTVLARMGFTTRIGHTADEILIKARKLASVMQIPTVCLRLPSVEELDMFYHVAAFIRKGLDFRASMPEGDARPYEWCMNRYGSAPGLAMHLDQHKVKTIMPGSETALSNVSFRLVIDLNMPA